MKATLYVEGVRTKQVETVTKRGGPIGRVAYIHGEAGAYVDRVYNEITYKSVLSEDQKAVVENVKTLAAKYGFELRVIDVTEKGLLQKLEDKLQGIGTFPCLVIDDGLKIEGTITEERIETLLLTRAKKNRGLVRAF